MPPVAARRQDPARSPPPRDAVASRPKPCLRDATLTVRARVAVDGRDAGRLLDREQRATHGLAWLATYVEAMRQLARLCGAACATPAASARSRSCSFASGSANTSRRCSAAFPMSQGEIVRPADLGLPPAQVAARMTPAGRGADRERQHRGAPRAPGRADARRSTARPSATAVSTRRWRRSATRCATSPTARWCRTRTNGISRNDYIPLEIIAQMAELGVFGLTIPEEYGGMGLGKESMCVVSEELSRGYIGVGSLGTRSEIAAELILGGGTEEQKQQVAAADRLRRSAADGGVHRAEHRLRPRLAARPARCATATSTRSTATRPGSPIRCAPT